MNLCIRCSNISTVPVNLGQDYTLIYTTTVAELRQAHNDGCLFCTLVFKFAVHNNYSWIDDTRSMSENLDYTERYLQMNLMFYDNIDCYIRSAFERGQKLDFNQHFILSFQQSRRQTDSRDPGTSRILRAFYLVKKDHGEFKRYL